MAPPGRGSSISPTMTPANIAKKYHACGARPAGAGSQARTIATAIGATAFQESFTVQTLGSALPGSARQRRWISRRT
jgi:hypothetical protein